MGGLVLCGVNRAQTPGGKNTRVGCVCGFQEKNPVWFLGGFQVENERGRGRVVVGVKVMFRC